MHRLFLVHEVDGVHGVQEVKGVKEVIEVKEEVNISPSILDLTNERGQRKNLFLLCRAKKKSRLACNGWP